jgi:plastocyanin domain-containing protein
MRKRSVVLTLAVAALAAAAGCGGGEGSEVQVAVTDRGFEPAEIAVKRGQNVTLAITRQTDMTCATDVVVAGTEIRQDLPLNQTVKISLGKVEADTVRFACGMGMIEGTIVAR